LTQDDKVKIGDLGMSKILFKTDQLISTRVGTPVYFAPEMIKNQLYSYPVDIWSMGCVFYALTML
jgi:serine/threonine protein kinase